jgi:hypothetical protein
MKSDVDKVGVWKDDNGMWHWTAFINDQPFTNSEGYKTKKEATAEADKNWPNLTVSDHKGKDPRTHKYEGEK